MTTDSENRAAALLESWRADVALFWRDTLTESQWAREWQVAALEDVNNPANKRIAIATAREGGKSRLEAMVGLHHLCTRPGSTVLAVAPIQRQASSAVWNEVEVLWAASAVLRGLFPHWRIRAAEIDTGVPGWRMATLASDNASALEGWHSPDMLILIDESQSLPDGHWSSLQGVNPSRLIACGTGGDDSGWFAEAFGHMKWLWDVTRKVTVLDMPRLREAYLREKKRLGEGSPVLRRMWLAEFCSASEYSIFEESLLKRARGRDLNRHTYMLGDQPPPIPEVVLGIDPARGGPDGDDCAVALLRGMNVERIWTLPPGDEMLLASEIVAEVCRSGAGTVAIEVGGLGHGVYARVRELLRGRRATVSAYNGSERSVHDANAANLKAEVVLRLRTLLLEGAIGLPSEAESFDRLSNELMGLRLVTTKDGRVRIQDPARSPDYADAMLAALSSVVISPGAVSGRVDWL